MGDLVLLHNSSIEKSHNVKLEDQWRRPYRIRESTDSSYYRLSELDGTELKGSFAGNRLKRFFSRQERNEDQGSDSGGSRTESEEGEEG